MRMIDANWLKENLGKVFHQECDHLYGMMQLIDEAPTLTPPNEAPPCYQPDGDGCAYQCYDGQDEPIEKCKECPLCCSDKQRHYTPPNEWVSVEERLPRVGGNYICAVQDKNGGTWTTPAEWNLEMKTWFGAFGEIKNKVTHRMPLPEPPTEAD